MAKTTEKANKALVLEAFDTLFNKRDYKTAERYWSIEPHSTQRAGPRQLYLPKSGSVCRRRVK